MDPATFILGHMADTPGCLPSLSGVHMEEEPTEVSDKLWTHIFELIDVILSAFWVVGTAFLQNVYTVFDVGKTRVGFAKLK
jgi:hypothetical protein